MAKKTYYGVYQRGKLVECRDADGYKMPLVFLSKNIAEGTAMYRTRSLKKPNTVKPLTF